MGFDTIEINLVSHFALQPSSSSSWLAELALISINPATPHPHLHPGKVYLVAETN